MANGGTRPPDKITPESIGAAGQQDISNFFTPENYPERTGWLGQIGSWAARGLENLASLSQRATWTQYERDMDYWIGVYESAPGEIEKQGALQKIQQVNIKMDELRTLTKTGAGNVRAIPAMIENPSLIGQWGEVAAQQDTAFGWQPPAVTTPGIPLPAVGLYGEGATGEGGMPTSKVPAGYEPQYFGGHGPVDPLQAAVDAAGGGAGYQVPIETYTEPTQPVQPIVDTGIGGVPEGAYAGDVVGGGTVNPLQAAVDAAGGGAKYQGINAYEGAGIPTPGGRGFKTYDQLRLAMEGAGRPRDEYGRVDTGVFQPWEIQEMYEGEYSRPDSLQQFLGGARGESYRGLINQRVDLGQGIQDYSVRRDAYGNIRSFMPARSSALHPSERLFRRY